MYIYTHSETTQKWAPSGTYDPIRPLISRFPVIPTLGVYIYTHFNIKYDSIWRDRIRKGITRGRVYTCSEIKKLINQLLKQNTVVNTVLYIKKPIIYKLNSWPELAKAEAVNHNPSIGTRRQKKVSAAPHICHNI